MALECQLRAGVPKFEKVELSLEKGGKELVEIPVRALKHRSFED